MVRGHSPTSRFRKAFSISSPSWTASRHVLSWRLWNTLDGTFRGARARAAFRHPRDLQREPGRPVRRRFTEGGAPAAHTVRPRSLPRQHLHRAAVALAEARGGGPPRNRRQARRRPWRRQVPFIEGPTSTEVHLDSALGLCNKPRSPYISCTGGPRALSDRSGLGDSVFGTPTPLQNVVHATEMASGDSVFWQAQHVMPKLQQTTFYAGVVLSLVGLRSGPLVGSMGSIPLGSGRGG